LENLQVATNVATVAINARGPLLISRLHDIPERAREIALHGVHHGVAVALADDPNMHEDLIREFDNASTAMVDIISAQVVVNMVFD
jgi:hypothetical protein